MDEKLKQDDLNAFDQKTSVYTQHRVVRYYIVVLQ